MEKEDCLIVNNIACSVNTCINKQFLFDGCRVFRLFGHVLKVFLPNVLPVSVAGIFRGQESEDTQSTDRVLTLVL